MAADRLTDPFLLSLDLAGRRVVVVGGGTRAQRRLPGLIAAGADVLVVAPDLTPAVEGMVSAGEVVWAPREYRAADLDDAWLAFACTGDPGVDAQVVADAEARRVFCAATTGGSAQAPATGAHDGAVVGVVADEQRRATQLCGALVDALRSGAVAEQAPDRPPAGVALVGGGPGDRDLITVRGRRLLALADVVVTDRLAPRDLLDELGPDVEVIDASKIPYGRAMAQQRINELLIEHAQAGRFVVRLKGGDPFVYGRGYEEVIACTEAGVPVTVVPGVTSAFAAPAAAGIPVSHRSVAHEIVVVSGHAAPGDPRSLVDWVALGRMRGTIVLLMAVERIAVFAAELMRHGRPPETPVAIVQDATTRIQRTVRGTLADIGERAREEEVRPPAVVVIGPVAGLTADSASWAAAAAAVR
ncbi:uroporphyrin-III C-methyltransferase / precorrin-2 dehydrogenase / sirohydrochlorin ferrochelatase [Pseudonocardia thermophila]|uniref:uroporphyrinogen-III C-methyltransferase n=1 Tax=Pseudonocardia thermophila TaxID=1848 RepID=A0A1M6PK91_PSETH|nr:uroporphyrinogen-III C-methyltransferase [Pseudonocardia thermophila]SHK08317.1 uroporphyrin-III C-methyltransferase / precorrin-2 dehydrogenase / sirohydrochlorin ferrochelatase [Pseudonocardia thermophila]